MMTPTGVPDRNASLHDRNNYLLEVSVRAGDELYSPDMRLCRQCHPTAPSFNGYTIGQVSLEYALALLETGGDAARADAIVARTIEFQDRDKDSPTYGNFRWMAHWTEVKDRNAVAFMTPNYCAIWQRHRARLSRETGQRMETMFSIARIGVDKHDVPWQYTNIFLLRLTSWLMLGRVMQDDRLTQQAADQWDVWLHGTSRGGVCEYNSPCYTPVALYALAGLWEECPDDTWQQSIQKVLQYLYTEFAANLHPGSLCLSGPMSRGYPMDYLNGSGLSAVIAYQQFGLYHTAKWDTNGGTTPFIVNFAIHHYEIPEHIRRIPWEAQYPYSVRTTVPEMRVTTCNYVDHKFTIGSACSLSLHPQAIPVFVCRATQRERRTAYLKVTPAMGAEVLCQQKSQWVLGWVCLASPGANAAVDAAPWRGVTWNLGPWRHVQQIRVDGQPYDGAHLACNRGLCIAMEIEGVLLGLIVHNATDGKCELQIIEKELHLRVSLPHSADLPRGGVAFSLEVRDAAECDTADFLSAFCDTEIEVHCAREGAKDVKLRNGNGLRLVLEQIRRDLNDADSRVYAVLHESPSLILHKGDLHVADKVNTSSSR